MKLLIFTIFDSKAGAFIPPFFLPTKQLAIRTFTDCINSKEHQFGKHPEDYSMFTIGEFDDQDSSIDYYETRRTVINGVSLVEIHKPEESDNVKISDDSPVQPSS